jgi:tetratricopeptide (TPR) repeat protein
VSQHHEFARTSQTTPDLVQEGWRNLHLQRPLAAWASWQRALRVDPGDEAARQALETLENAVELPPAARAVYRFRTTSDPARRARWDARLRTQGLDDLAAAAEVFAAIAHDDPSDSDALLNLSLCHAWLGRNVDAIGCLDRVVTLLAASDAESASDAWMLAEVLADDFRFAWVVEWHEGPPPGLLDAWPNLVPVKLPDDPLPGSRGLDEAQVFEWLDRPAVRHATAMTRAEDLPRVLASVISTPKMLRLSSPNPTGFVVLSDPALAGIRQLLGQPRKERTPLAIAWADSALGTFRLPGGLDDATRSQLARAVVEHYYEDLWIHLPRQALGDLSPLEAARVSASGDALVRAKLTAVVRFREQLGTRATHAAIYQGYPFDRLRRRLGLLPSGEGTVDANDLSCASAAELDEIEPATLDDQRLLDAFTSALGLREDARVARFAAEVARRESPTLARVDSTAVFAPLVREALKAGDPEAALDWLSRAVKTHSGPLARTFTVWSAEILARTGSPSASLRAYQGLLDESDAEAALALDGAETLLDNGYPDLALPLLVEARSRGLASGDVETARKAEFLLDRGRDR